ncbi:MAG TPA: S1C family serine protease [Casimicrobiaceae bacterium]|nr:S1C family serine protease [Casimicrobiaceae bacterium]
MAETGQWAFPAELRPAHEELAFDLRPALDAVVMIHTEVPEDAFTAQILGTERLGSGALIRDDGLILTIGYVITEAESIWITAANGQVLQGHTLAYDFATGLGLVQALGRLDIPVLKRGSAARLRENSDVLVIGHGGIAHALSAQVVAKREFAGYWEYLLDEAIYTTPPHPEWAGAALLDVSGRLVGIGSLLVQEKSDEGTAQGNMFVPIDVLEPVLTELTQHGRRLAPARPWLGVYATERDGHMIVSGIAPRGPAQRAGLRVGDVVVQVASENIDGLADAYRKIWSLGAAGVMVPLTIAREGVNAEVRIHSVDRADLLRKPKLQ